GDIILGGTAEFSTATTYFDFRIMKVNSSGTTVWSLTQDSGFGKLDKPKAMALDASGNIYIGGSGFTTVGNLEDMLLMKISNNGALLWKSLHSGNNQANDHINAIAVNLSNNHVYVTGKLKSLNSAEDFHTRAYNSSGSLLWANTYTSIGNHFDEATDITLKNSFLYVSGYTFNSGQSNNYQTLKYDLLGNQKWAKSFNHTTNQSDKAYKVVVDNQNNIIVTGSSYGGTSQNTDFATIKYCQHETLANADTAICKGSSVTLSASAIGGSNYIWSVVSGTPISTATLSCTNCISPTASPLVTTVYAVRSENSIGCIDFDTVTITVNEAIKPIITANPSLSFCVGDSTVLNVNNQTYNSYSWNNGGNTAHKTVSNVGMHIVNIVDNNGCTNADTVNTIHHSLPNVDAGPAQSICTGQSAQLQATGALSYVWQNTPSLSQYIIPNPVASPNSTQTYTVTGTDNNGCKATDNITITVNTLPVITTSGNTTICVGDTVQLSASGANSYSWNNSNSLLNANSSTPSAYPSQNTTYIVTGTDANNCQSQASVTVSANAVPFISAGVNQTICIGDSVNLFATGGATYQWMPHSSLSALNISNPWASPTSQTDYIVAGTNANGCTNSDTVSVFVNPLPIVSAGFDTAVCIFNSLILNSSGAVSYTWEPSPSLTGINTSSPTVQPTTTTTYTVLGTNNSGCSATANVVVTVNPLPNINAGPDLSVCIGDSIQLMANGGISYQWDFDNTLSQLNIPNPYANPNIQTTYQVMGTDINGCQNTDNVTVSINSLPTIFAGNDLTVCIGSNVQLQASGGSSYTWDNTSSLSNFNTFNPITNPMQSTEWFFVTGFDMNNCANRDSVKITVNPLPNPPVLTDTFPNIISSYVFGNTWYFNGNLLNGFNNDTLNYVNLGNLGVYTVTHTDFNGCTSDHSLGIDITKLIDDVGIFEFSVVDFDLVAYPNPVENILTVDLTQNIDKIIIVDMRGRVVLTNDEIQSGLHDINMSSFESGIYMLVAYKNQNWKSLKIVKP
ncbi:MAG: T9SS type A sorting domain-containing protein, partial [Putridiphycobacter sp.]|nr:T9SS type A sorting domain-containing protein [Putridiphycobacter sp.]